jgi:hypothetical protein
MKHMNFKSLVGCSISVEPGHGFHSPLAETKSDLETSDTMLV